jgi:hypothetical protein
MGAGGLHSHVDLNLQLDILPGNQYIDSTDLLLLKVLLLLAIPLPPPPSPPSPLASFEGKFHHSTKQNLLYHHHIIVLPFYLQRHNNKTY